MYYTDKQFTSIDFLYYIHIHRLQAFDILVQMNRLQVLDF